MRSSLKITALVLFFLANQISVHVLFAQALLQPEQDQQMSDDDNRRLQFAETLLKIYEPSGSLTSEEKRAILEAHQMFSTQKGTDGQAAEFENLFPYQKQGKYNHVAAVLSKRFPNDYKNIIKLWMDHGVLGLTPFDWAEEAFENVLSLFQPSPKRKQNPNQDIFAQLERSGAKPTDFFPLGGNRSNWPESYAEPGERYVFSMDFRNNPRTRRESTSNPVYVDIVLKEFAVGEGRDLSPDEVQFDLKSSDPTQPPPRISQVTQFSYPHIPNAKGLRYRIDGVQGKFEIHPKILSDLKYSITDNSGESKYEIEPNVKVIDPQSNISAIGINYHSRLKPVYVDIVLKEFAAEEGRDLSPDEVKFDLKSSDPTQPPPKISQVTEFMYPQIPNAKGLRYRIDGIRGKFEICPRTLSDLKYSITDNSGESKYEVEPNVKVIDPQSNVSAIGINYHRK